MEEELQNSVAVSDEDAEFEEDIELGGFTADNADAFAVNAQLQNGMVELKDGEDLEGGPEDEDAEGEDEDAEGEDDDEVAPHAREVPIEDEEDAEDEEGVGAVKIQPTFLDEEEEDGDATSGAEEDDSSASEGDESKDSTDAEVEVEWEPAVEDEDEIANPNRCMYVWPACLWPTLTLS